MTALIGATVYDLSQPLESAIPTSPNHPGFRHALTRRHGDWVRDDGGSAASDILVMGSHTGTHIDALAHISSDGLLHGGTSASLAQTGGRFIEHGVHAFPVRLRRGVMLDFPRLFGIDALEGGQSISGSDLDLACAAQGCTVTSGDSVLIRTGWSRYWSDPLAYIGRASGVPGPDESAADWFIAKGVSVVGSDTLAFEVIKPQAGHSLMPVHSRLLVDGGIFIIESLNLDALAIDHVYTFVLAVFPLKIVGATGSPIRPVAVV